MFKLEPQNIFKLGRSVYLNWDLIVYLNWGLSVYLNWGLSAYLIGASVYN